MKKTMAATKTPAAIGLYSQAVEVEGFLSISGQLPIDGATGTMPGDRGEQAQARHC